jgi:hypothetical protein
LQDVAGKPLPEATVAGFARSMLKAVGVDFGGRAAEINTNSSFRRAA